MTATTNHRRGLTERGQVALSAQLG